MKQFSRLTIDAPLREITIAAEEADFVRARFEEMGDKWEATKHHFPDFARFIAGLPDSSEAVNLQNPILREVFLDAVCEARGLPWGTLSR